MTHTANFCSSKLFWRSIASAVLLTLISILLLTACQEANTMGIQAAPVDTRKYFADPRMATFAEAVQQGDVAKVKAELSSGIDPNTEGLEGFRPIFFIFTAKNTDVAHVLLKAGANPNVRLSDGTPPLQFAVRMENPNFTQTLLEHKADPNAKGPNEKPMIHEAVLLGGRQQLQLLAKAGADLNVSWGIGTPLFAAIGAVNYEAATALLDLGADVNWRSPGGKHHDTAGELFCSLMGRLHATPKNRKPLQELFAAFARRGVILSCSAEVERFK